jgi:hypothetical protein
LADCTELSDGGGDLDQSNSGAFAAQFAGFARVDLAGVKSGKAA